MKNLFVCFMVAVIFMAALGCNNFKSPAGPETQETPADSTSELGELVLAIQSPTNSGWYEARGKFSNEPRATSLLLQPGTYFPVATAEGFVPQLFTAVITPGGRVVIENVRLEPILEEEIYVDQQPRGHVVIRTSDGIYEGSAPARFKGLSGLMTVEHWLEGYQTKFDTLRVNPGEAKIVFHDFKSLPPNTGELVLAIQSPENSGWYEARGKFSNEPRATFLLLQPGTYFPVSTAEGFVPQLFTAVITPGGRVVIENVRLEPILEEEIYVDQQPRGHVVIRTSDGIYEGSAPARFKGLSGLMTVEHWLEGYQTKFDTLRVNPGEAKIVFHDFKSLPPNTGELVLAIQSPTNSGWYEARGKFSNEPRATSLLLQPGTYFPVATAEGFVPQLFTAVITPGGRVVIENVRLEPILEEEIYVDQQPRGHVVIRTSDGIYEGSAPARFKGLSGLMTVEHWLEGYQTKFDTLRVNPGEAKIVFHDFKSLPPNTGELVLAIQSPENSGWYEARGKFSNEPRATFLLLQPGTYFPVSTAEGFVPQLFTAVITPGGRVVIENVRLEPILEEEIYVDQQPRGHVVIRTSDGIYEGSAPARFKGLSGLMTVEHWLEGYQTKFDTLRVNPGEAKIVFHDFKSLPPNTGELVLAIQSPENSGWYEARGKFSNEPRATSLFLAPGTYFPVATAAGYTPQLFVAHITAGGRTVIENVRLEPSAQTEIYVDQYPRGHVVLRTAQGKFEGSAPAR